MTHTFAKAGPTKRMMLLALALVWGCAAATAKAPPKVTGTFSNLTYNSEGGDVLGTWTWLDNGDTIADLRISLTNGAAAAAGASSRPRPSS